MVIINHHCDGDGAGGDVVDHDSDAKPSQSAYSAPSTLTKTASEQT